MAPPHRDLIEFSKREVLTALREMVPEGRGKPLGPEGENTSYAGRPAYDAVSS
jgi:hypothetical protein